MSISTTFNQVDEWLDSITATKLNGLFDWVHIDVPHLHGEIVTTTSEEIVTISRCAEISNLCGMSNESHSFIGISGQWHFNEADNLFVS